MIALKLACIANRLTRTNISRLSHTTLWSTNLVWFGHFFHRVNTVATDQEDHQSEKELVKTAFRRCRYEGWSFKKERAQRNNLKLLPRTCRGSQRNWHEFSAVTVSPLCFKPHQILRKILVASKDRTKVEDQMGVVYRIPCGGCNKVYVGETKRSVGERIK